MRKLVFVLSLLIATPALAEEIAVHVNGMVCAFCAVGVEQLLSDEKGVEKVHVDLDSATVHVTTAPHATLTDTRLKELIGKAGFDAGEISRQ